MLSASVVQQSDASLMLTNAPQHPRSGSIHGFTIGFISVAYLFSRPLFPHLTDYHAKSFANEPSKRCPPDTVDIYLAK